MTPQNKSEIIKKAKQRAENLKLLRRDPRFQHVMGRLVQEGLLVADNIKPNKRKIFLKDALWVGENIEPRVFELLPAIALKRPAILMDKDYPDDLKKVMNDLRKGKNESYFRGIPLKKCQQWLPHIGRKGQLPSMIKNFRLSKEDQALLKRLSLERGTSESQVIRDALKKL